MIITDSIIYLGIAFRIVRQCPACQMQVLTTKKIAPREMTQLANPSLMTINEIFHIYSN